MFSLSSEQPNKAGPFTVQPNTNRAEHEHAEQSRTEPNISYPRLRTIEQPNNAEQSYPNSEHSYRTLLRRMPPACMDYTDAHK